MTKEVMKQALEALRMPCEFWNKTQFIKVTEAIKALEEALKQEQEYEVLAGIGKGVEIPAGWKYYYIKPKLPLQQKQEQGEPVAWWNGEEGVVFAHDQICIPNWTDHYYIPLYTTPQTKEWVGLTDEEISKVLYDSGDPDGLPEYARAIEAKLKEKNETQTRRID